MNIRVLSFDSQLFRDSADLRALRGALPPARKDGGSVSGHVQDGRHHIFDPSVFSFNVFPDSVACIASLPRRIYVDYYCMPTCTPESTNGLVIFRSTLLDRVAADAPQFFLSYILYFCSIAAAT